MNIDVVETKTFFLW